MLKKPRTVPKELTLLKSLNTRLTLPLQDQKKLFALEKGFEGEVKFDQLLSDHLKSPCWILNGLLLEAGGSTFQIDNVLIFQQTIVLTDVKNFEDDYHYDAQGNFMRAGEEKKDPLLQLERCTSLFRQLLQQYGFRFQVESYLVFINPEFTLYNAPQNESIILPTKLNHFIKKLNHLPSKLNEGHEKLADLLVSLDLGDFPFSKKPEYTYEQLRKGVVCLRGCGWMRDQSIYKVVCDCCGYVEWKEKAVMRCVMELQMLFPERKITTNQVYEWCGMMVSKKLIRRVLKETFDVVGNKRFAYYCVKNRDSKEID